MSMTLNPANEIPDNITRSEESVLRSDLSTVRASVPSTSMVPTLTPRIFDLRIRTANRSARALIALLVGKDPSSTPTTFRSSMSALLKRFWYVSKQSSSEVVFRIRVSDYSWGYSNPDLLCSAISSKADDSSVQNAHHIQLVDQSAHPSLRQRFQVTRAA